MFVNLGRTFITTKINNVIESINVCFSKSSPNLEIYYTVGSWDCSKASLIIKESTYFVWNFSKSITRYLTWWWAETSIGAKTKELAIFPSQTYIIIRLGYRNHQPINMKSKKLLMKHHYMEVESRPKQRKSRSSGWNGINLNLSYTYLQGKAL